jgi:hypothetical protein
MQDTVLKQLALAYQDTYYRALGVGEEHPDYEKVTKRLKECEYRLLGYSVYELNRESSGTTRYLPLKFIT